MRAGARSAAGVFASGFSGFVITFLRCLAIAHPLVCAGEKEGRVGSRERTAIGSRQSRPALSSKLQHHHPLPKTPTRNASQRRRSAPQILRPLSASLPSRHHLSSSLSFKLTWRPGFWSSFRPAQPSLWPSGFHGRTDACARRMQVCPPV